MYIEHLAIWCKDLETMKDFYVKYFDGVPNNKYHNPNKQFSSYFLRFEKGPRIELMQMPGIPDNLNDVMKQFMGLIHFAISVGSEEKVKHVNRTISADGFVVVRRTAENRGWLL
jgi:lactoylglutathione lyase